MRPSVFYSNTSCLWNIPKKRQVSIGTAKEVVLAEPTGNLRHPIIPPLAEEFTLGRQICGLVQCAVEDIDVVASIGLGQVSTPFNPRLGEI